MDFNGKETQTLVRHRESEAGAQGSRQPAINRIHVEVLLQALCVPQLLHNLQHDTLRHF